MARIPLKQTVTNEFKPGAEIEVAHPFVREKYTQQDEDGTAEVMSWRPGTRQENILPDDAEEVADGIGTQVIRIVSVHKPGKYPTRVFFTRSWRDPQGNEFGKNKLCIAVASAFRRRCRGYSVEYRLKETA